MRCDAIAYSNSYRIRWHNEKYEDTGRLKQAVDEYIHYYNHEGIKKKLNGLSPVQHRTLAMTAAG